MVVIYKHSFCDGFQWSAFHYDREVNDYQSITHEFNAYMKEKQLEKNASKKPHEMLTPYCRVQWLDGTIGVYLYKNNDDNTNIFAWKRHPNGELHIDGAITDGGLCSGTILGATISHIYARPFASLDEATNEELIDPSKRGELVWQREDSKLKELQKAAEEAMKALADYKKEKGVA